MNRIVTFAALAALLAGACGKDQLVEPEYGAGCSKGTLVLGDTLHGTLGLASCVQDYSIWSDETVLYDTYHVHFDAGKGYLIRMQAESATPVHDSVDALLQFWGTDANGTRVPLGISDDDGRSSNHQYDSELWFVAPTTGDFEMFAMNYDVVDSGGYRIAFQPCPVVAALDTAGTYAGLTLTAPPANGCLRHDLAGTVADSTGAVLASMPLDINDSVVVTVITTGGFQPAIEAGGPGFDVYDNVYTTSRFVSADPYAPDTAQVGFTAAEKGNYSVLVGAKTYGDAGTFEITVQKQAVPAPVAREVKALKAPPAQPEKHRTHR